MTHTNRDSRFQMLLLRKCWCDIFLLCAIQWSLPFESGFLFCTLDPVNDPASSSDGQTTAENSPTTSSDNQAADSSTSKSQSTAADSPTDGGGGDGKFGEESKRTKAEQLNERTGNTSNASSQENVYLSEIRSLRECMQRFRQLDVDESEFACLKALALLRPEMKGLEDAQRVESMQDQAQLILIQHVKSRSPPTRFGKLLFLLASLRAFSPENIRKIYLAKFFGDLSIDNLLYDYFN